MNQIKVERKLIELTEWPDGWWLMFGNNLVYGPCESRIELKLCVHAFIYDAKRVFT